MNNKKWRSFFYELEETQKPKFDPSLSLISENIFDSLDLTHLSESEIVLLMEGRKENVLKKYGNILGLDTIQDLADFDEQYKFKHLGWMAKTLANEVGDDEDIEYPEEKIETITSAVSDFVRYKDLMKKKDVNMYSDVNELLDAIKEDVINRRIRKARKEREKGRHVSDQLYDSGQASVIYEDDQYFVIRPFTRDSSCYFGSKTSWCIAQEHNQMFAQYTEGEGKIFYFIKDDSKRPDDYNVKMSVEITMINEEISFDIIWDRHNNPIDVGGGASELAMTLMDEFEMSHESAEGVASAIAEHAEMNPPENSGLSDLEERINNGEFNGGFVSFNAYLESYDTPYLSLTAYINFRMPIENQRMIELLDNDEFDHSGAEEAIWEELTENEELWELIEGDATISFSRDMLVDLNGCGAECVEVSINDNALDNEPAEYVLNIKFTNVQDENNSYITADNIHEAENFLEEMQEEWGERNELDLQEAFAEHVYRFIPQIAQEGAQEFRNLKQKFMTGTYELNDNVWYTVDDDTDENSDLNLMAEFKFEFTKEMLDWLFDGEEMRNASGNNVMKARRNRRDANTVLRAMLSPGMGTEETGLLDRAIYNVYQNAVAFAQKQLKLDFGPDFNFEDDLVFPETPSSTNVRVAIEVAAEEAGLVPYSANLATTFSIYIPFHKSEAELSAIMNFFLFIKDNYDEISSYIYKYVGQYASKMTNMSQPRPDQILREDVYLDILDTQTFLKSIKKQLRKR